MYSKRAAASGRFPLGRRDEDEDFVSSVLEEAFAPQLPGGFNRVVKVSAWVPVMKAQRSSDSWIDITQAGA